MSVSKKVYDSVKKARAAFHNISAADTNKKNLMLENISRLLIAESKKIIQANGVDIKNNQQLSDAKIDRLLINEKRIEAIIDSIDVIRRLENPIGKMIDSKKLPNGLLLLKQQIPIGLIFIIYESRPNVTIDAAALCLKAGNCVILKGGKEAINTNRILSGILTEALKLTGLSEDAVYFVDTTDRGATKIILKMDDLVDLVIPRGGTELIHYVSETSKIPVIKHEKGLCHIYIDSSANLQSAKKIVYNAKVQRPAVCNSVETLLVNSSIADNFLPEMASELTAAKVKLIGCEKTEKIINVARATEGDWNTEYLDLILSIKIVGNIDEAIAHINHYGSHHSDAIVTENFSNAMKFADVVDSAAVYVNSSTRFTDGGAFGMGAEIGISTNRLHARGPMGLNELTTYKYVILGNGQIR